MTTLTEEKTMNKMKSVVKKRPDYVLFDKATRAIICNDQPKAILRMLDFDFISGRNTPSVAAIVNPSGGSYHHSMFGDKEILIPVYATVSEASEQHPEADVLINYASFRSAYSSSRQALLHPNIRTVVVVAEGVPEKKAKELAAKAKRLNKWLIGPATVGGIAAGAFKVGNTGGTIDNIIYCKLHRPGSVGFISKSGGMSNEMYNVISKNANGIYEGIALGGDRFPGNTPAEHLIRMNQNPDIKMLVYLGEVGGHDEYEIIDAMREGKITKPIVAWISGTCAKLFPSEVQFGHAGAKANSDRESADVKINALKKAGVVVPDSFDGFGKAIANAFKKITISPVAEPVVPKLPLEYDDAIRSKQIRKKPSILSTISDDRGEEVTYNGIPLSRLIRENKGIGSVVGHLWFKKSLPSYATEFIEMVLMLVADHGPAVSASHNAIVAARAGKDVVSALASGLLTIGPRFGGAIDDAARIFSESYDKGLTPQEFVQEMKKKNIRVPGIGHRIKSLDNPDTRVTLLKEYVKKYFVSSPLLDYALQVEALTTKKKNTLILNVDGAIGVAFVDLLRSCGAFTREEADKYIRLGALNGLFIVGRSIGIIGHILDQKRLDQPLYRHAFDDIAYLT